MSHRGNREEGIDCSKRESFSSSVQFFFYLHPVATHPPPPPRTAVFHWAARENIGQRDVRTAAALCQMSVSVSTKEESCEQS